MTSTHPHHAEIARTLHAVRRLATAYFGLSLLTLGVIYLLRDHHSQVNPVVWVRGTIVAVSSGVTLLLALRAARGSRGAFRRLRVVSVVVVLGVVYIIAAQPLPLWMKIEQGACGVLMLGAAVVVNGRRVRGLFAAG